MDVLIRDLPDDVHAELSRRAQARDMSLRAYLREVLSEHVAVPSIEEWLSELSGLTPIDPNGPTGPGLVAQSRGEDDLLLQR